VTAFGEHSPGPQEAADAAVLVQLRRQANQVSHEHVCAHGNKSGYADGEQGPKNMNLLGAEVEAVHLFRSRSASICYLLVARASAAVLF